MTLRLLDVPMRKTYQRHRKVYNIVQAQYETSVGPKWGNLITTPDALLEDCLTLIEIELEKWVRSHDPSQR